MLFLFVAPFGVELGKGKTKDENVVTAKTVFHFHELQREQVLLWGLR